MTLHEPLNISQRAKLTVEDFLALSERGAFDGYAKSELIEGEIWVVNAIHRRHAKAHATIVGELFIATKADNRQLTIYANPSTELSNISLPEPDVVVADPDDGKMVNGPSVRIAIEISDSTLDMDLGRKVRLYAKHGVPEYWVVDLQENRVHQHWAPADQAYGQVRQIAFGERLTAATVEGLVIDTAGL
jgi:Uma2 family endonuclease